MTGSSVRQTAPGSRKRKRRQSREARPKSPLEMKFRISLASLAGTLFCVAPAFVMTSSTFAPIAQAVSDAGSLGPLLEKGGAMVLLYLMLQFMIKQFSDLIKHNSTIMTQLIENSAKQAQWLEHNAGIQEQILTQIKALAASQSSAEKTDRQP